MAGLPITVRPMFEASITQLNKDNARLVTEAGTAAKRLREALMHGEKLQEALNRALADHARAEAGRDAPQGLKHEQSLIHCASAASSDLSFVPRSASR